jgi:hypothetical protein
MTKPSADRAPGPQYLVIPSESRSDVESLLALTHEQLRALIDEMRSPKHLREGVPTYVAAATAMKLPNAVTVDVLDAVFNVRAQRARYKLSDEQLLTDLARIDPHLRTLSDEHRASLLELLSKSEEDHVLEKVESLRSALMPHMVRARTVVDVRPVFDQERKHATSALLRTCLEIESHDSDHEYLEPFVVQMDEAQVQEMIEVLQIAQKKLATLKAQLGDRLEFFE